VLARYLAVDGIGILTISLGVGGIALTVLTGVSWRPILCDKTAHFDNIITQNS